jgi:hypothetical protein
MISERHGEGERDILGTDSTCWRLSEPLSDDDSSNSRLFRLLMDAAADDEDDEDDDDDRFTWVSSTVTSAFVLTESRLVNVSVSDMAGSRCCAG